MLKPPPYAHPGWYPDPTGAGGQRYWDGSLWGPAAPPIPRRLRYGTERAWRVPAFVGILVVVLGTCVCVVTAQVAAHHRVSEASAPAAAASPIAVTSVRPARVAEEVRDGAFAFVVTRVTRSKVGGHPSNTLMQATAHGEYLNVHLTVRNSGSQPQSFFATIQQLAAGGRTYLADDMVSVWNNSASVHINPGNTIEAVASFDVPVGTPAGVLELHDTPMSRGAEVQL